MKKLLLLTKSLLAAALLCVGQNAWGDSKILYQQNYESESDASTWTTTIAKTTLTLETDGGQGYGKYIKFYADGAGGDRCAYTNFYTTGNDFYSDNSSYTMEFDATVRMGNTASKPTHLVVASEGYSFAYNASFASKNTTNKNYLFLLENASDASANSTTYYINGGATAYTIAADSWFHVRLDVNVSTKTISYTLSGAVTASGSYTITDESSIKAQGIVANVNKGTYGTVKIDNIVITAGHLEDIKYNLNVGTSASTTISSSTSTSDVTNILNISVDQTKAAGDGAGASDRTTKLPIKTGANGETFDDPTNYVLFKYSVAAGKKFIPTSVKINVANVGSSSNNNIKYKATMYDAKSSFSSTYVGKLSNGTVEVFNFTNDEEVAFKGDVTLKLWAWTIESGDGKGSAFRMGTPLEIKGVIVDTSVEIANAIADCKAHETSDDFATAIDAESFGDASEVYAFHTNWQIAKADAASSNDITKVIFDAAVSDFTRWNNARNNYGQQYTGAPDNKYFDAWNNDPSDGKQKIYGLPAGTYTLKVATRASEDVTDKSKYNVWVSGGSADASVLGNHIGNAGGCLGNGWNWTILSFTLDAKADVEIGFYSCPPTDRWAGADDWHLYKGSLSETATIGAKGYTTFSSSCPLNLGGISGGSAYKVVTADVAGTVVTPSAVTGSIAAGEGLILSGDPGAPVTIPVVASGDAISGNLMVGCPIGATITSETPNYEKFYVLVNGDTEAKFANLTDYVGGGETVTIPANKAYLYIPSVSARSMSIVLGDKVTGVANVEAAAEAKAKEGKFIENGKLVIVKNGQKFNAAGAKLY